MAGRSVIRSFVRPGVMATKKYTDFGRPLEVKAKNKGAVQASGLALQGVAVVDWMWTSWVFNPAMT